MTDLITHPYTQALGWTLVHFLWQGAAIGLASFALLRVLRTSHARYTAGVVSLALLLAAPVVTFAMLVRPPAVAHVSQSTGVTTPDTALPSSAGSSISSNSSSPSGRFNPAGPFSPAILFAVLSAWLIGVAVLSVRLAGGWMVARLMAKEHVRPAAAEIQALAKRVAGRLALERIVSVFESSAVSVPVMIGWIKPAVLLPVAALSGLSTTQIEALLAHELAHVQRHDYLVNLLQSVVETLLFYHPAVWWVSRQVRSEREHCCDDLAVAVCDRLVYVTALADLATMSSAPRLALAATDGSLARRVRRLLGRDSDDNRRSAFAWLPLMFVGLLVAALIPVAAARSGEATPNPIADEQTAAAPKVAVDAARAAQEAAAVAKAAAEVPTELALALTTMGEQSGGERQITEQQRQQFMALFEKLQAQMEELRQALRQVTGAAETESRQTAARRKQVEAESQMVELKRRLETVKGNVEERSRQATNAAADARKLSEQARQFERLSTMKEKGLVAESELQAAQKAMLDAKLRIESKSASTEKLKAETARALDRLKMDQAERMNELASKSVITRQRGYATTLSPEAASMRDRLLQENSRLSDDTVLSLIKSVGKLDGDTNRAEVLITVARVRQFTPEMVSAYLSAADNIRAESERARVLDQPIRLKPKGRE